MEFKELNIGNAIEYDCKTLINGVIYVAKLARIAKANIKSPFQAGFFVPEI